MSPLLVLLGIGIVLWLYWTAGGLPVETRKRFGRTVTVVAIAVGLLFLVRVGQPWLAAFGTVVIAALRWLGPILVRLLPLLLVQRGKRPPGIDEPGDKVRASVSSPMTRAEALEVLGLTEGASDEAVRGAYSALIKKVHPDQGGTAYLASRVNLARDLLLSKQKR